MPVDDILDDPVDWLGPVRSADAARRLARARESGLGSAFRALCGDLLSAAPELARETGFADGAEVLGRLSFTAVRPVLTHPAFDRWVHRGLALTGRGAHHRLPTGALRTHLAAIGGFVLAALAHGGGDGEVDVPVDGHGRVLAHGLGDHHVVPAELAGLRVRCTVVGGSVTGLRLISDGRDLPVEPWRLPSTAEGWWLDTADPVLSSAQPYPAGDPDVLLDLFAEAWALARIAAPAYTEEIAATLRVLRPVPSAPEDPPCLGLWEAEPRGAEDAALALLTGHQLAKARVALVRTVDRPADWTTVRDGLLAGVEAHAAVVFWHGLAGSPRAEHRLPSARAALGAVVADLADRFGHDGVVVRAISFWHPDIGSEQTVAAPANSVRTRQRTDDDEAVERFIAAWTSAGGEPAVRSGPDTVDIPACLRAAAELTGAREGHRANPVYSGVDRQDPLLDRLGLDNVVAHDRVQRLRALLDSLPVTADPFERVLRGHVDYVGADMDGAAHHYLAAVSAVPHCVDIWHDLAFALLHLGRWEPRVFLFAPDLFVRLAAGVRLDAAAAARVLGEEPGPDPGTTDSLDTVLLFMRAVDHALGLEVR